MHSHEYAELLQFVDSSAEAMVAAEASGISARWNRGAQRLFGHVADALFRSLFDAIPVGLGVFDEDGFALRANPALLAFSGLAENDLLGRNFREIAVLHRSGLCAAAERALRYGRQPVGEFRLTAADGIESVLECEFIVTKAQGQRYLLLVARDVTKFHAAERALAVAKQKTEARAKSDRVYRQVLETLADGFLVLDGKGCILEVNRAFAQMLGYTEAELLKKRLADVDESYSPEAVLEFVSRLLTTGNVFAESRYRHKNGRSIDVELLASWLPVEGGRVFIFVRDISERRRSEEDVRQLAFYDPLTRLPNRRLLLERMQQALFDSQRTRLHGALVFIDIDNFKHLNETQGREFGDQLLIELGRRLQACVRAHDMVARIGDDEFVLLLEGLDGDAERSAVLVEAMLKNLVQALNAAHSLDRQEECVSPSIGITLFCNQQISADELLQRAALAMQQAKVVGCNTARYFEPEMQSAIDARSLLETEIRRSLHANRFLLHFQPQIDRGGRLVGAEALVRWRHPERGLIGPKAFIPFAEEAGLMLPLGQRVLELAYRQLGKWGAHKSLGDLRLAVNVSRHQFMHAGFAAQVQEIIDSAGIAPGQMVLELTESVLQQDLADSMKKMDELKRIGVAFSLDDFGTGNSSLSFLKRLPFDQIKIDASCVRAMLTSSDDAAVVRAVIAMGHSLGMQVVAEGVETAAHWELLCAAGCDLGQGDYFGAPAMLAEFLQAWAAPQRRFVH